MESRLDRERTRKPRLVGGVRGAIKNEYIIRLRLMNLRFPYRAAPPCGRRGASQLSEAATNSLYQGIFNFCFT
jgi:hypothetical protein